MLRSEDLIKARSVLKRCDDRREEHGDHRRRIRHRSATPGEAPELRRGARRWADARLRPRFGRVPRHAQVGPTSPRRRPHLLYALPSRPYGRRRSSPLRHQLRRTRETYVAPLLDRSRAFPPVLGLPDGRWALLWMAGDYATLVSELPQECPSPI